MFTTENVHRNEITLRFEFVNVVDHGWKVNSGQVQGRAECIWIRDVCVFPASTIGLALFIRSISRFLVLNIDYCFGSGYFRRSTDIFKCCQRLVKWYDKFHVRDSVHRPSSSVAVYLEKLSVIFSKEACMRSSMSSSVLEI